MFLSVDVMDVDDGFEGVPRFSYEHDQEGWTVFGIAGSIGLFYGESSSSLVVFVAC